MCKRVLLINPNRCHHPPVIPIGLEYISHALKHAGHETRLLDLCFLDEPKKRVAHELTAFKPDAVCVTIRNVDTVLYPETVFFLPAIKDMIMEVRSLSDAPIITGGAGMGVDPEGIVSFLEADAGVIGPGETTLVEMLSRPGEIRGSGKVFRGVQPEDFTYIRQDAACWAEYIENGGLGGFTTHSGCSSACPYCIEASTPVMLRNPVSVALEVTTLLDSGMDHLHLCDPEFNELPEHAEEVLREMVKRAPAGLKWALYMRPGHYSPALFELLGKSGAYLITLSVDTCVHNKTYLKDVSEMIHIAKDNGIQTCIDLLAGLPGEEDGAFDQTLEALLNARPKETVINTTLRLCKTLPITRTVLGSEAHRKYIIDNGAYAGSLLAPVFYQRLTPGDIKRLAGDNARIRIAGEEKIVNYQSEPGQSE